MKNSHSSLRLLEPLINKKAWEGESFSLQFWILNDQGGEI
jgi:hypothetical protein